MFKIVKYLKKSILPILAIVVLLVIQASSDLSLPDYTSKIVNIGIQQGGVTNEAPDLIRETQMKKLFTFMSEADSKTVLESYKLLPPNTKTNKHNLSKEYALYQLDTKDEDAIASLGVIFEKPMLIVGGIESGAEQFKPMEEQMRANLPPQIKDSNMSSIEIIAMMPQEQREALITEINAKFKEMPEAILSQTAIAFTKSEYESIGIKTDKLQSNYILSAGGKMILLALIGMIASITVGLIAARVAAKLGMDLRGLVFRKVVSFSNVELDKFSSASLITRSTNDIQQVQMLMVMLLRIIFYAPILGVGGIIKVLGTNTSMAWIIAVAVMAILSLVIVMFALAMPKFKLLQKLVDRLNLVTREILNGVPVIRAFSTQKHEEKRFDKVNRDLTKTNIFIGRMMSLMMPMMMLIMNGIAILIVWKGAYSIDAGTMQVGDMMAFIQYTMQIIMSFLMISMMSIMLPRASVSANRISEVLRTDIAITNPENPKQLDNISSDKKGVVEFKNVSFRYPNAQEDVLSDISFTAKRGQTTAFIGSTGSGKSTLINLIPRFYDVTQGEVLIDGENVKEISQHDLRAKLGYVPQKGVLFSGTIESNIKYGNKNISDELMKKSAEVAQASEFIEKLDESYGLDISQGGTNVSGGQKQRLSIARAIATSPEIYIFDDSFSALDYKTDINLRKALKAHTSDSTVLIVAQRISTILHAEQIIVLDEGRIIGRGTHKELLKNCEVYNQIASSQLSKEELDHEYE